MSESSSTRFSESDFAEGSDPTVDDWQEWVDGGIEHSADSASDNPSSGNSSSDNSSSDNPSGSSSSSSRETNAVEGEYDTKEIAGVQSNSTAGALSSALPQGKQQLPASPVALVETAFLASTTSLLWLINSYFPIGPLWRICFPIPIALVYLRWNRRAAWMATAVSMLLLVVFTGPVRSLFFLMPSGVLGVLLGFCWRRKASWGFSIFLGTIISTLGFFFRVALTSVLLNEDLWIYVTTQVTKLINWVSVRLGLLFQPELSMVQLLAVVLVLVNSMVYLFAVHLAAWFLLKRLGAQVSDPPRWVQVMLELEVD